MDKKRTVLITGAAGDVGSALAQRIPTDKYELLLGDIRKPEYSLNAKFIRFDITDLQNFKEVCKDVDILIHLAGEREPSAEWSDVLKLNVSGTYNALEAAHCGGCKRVIYASSVHVYSGYKDDVSVGLDMPVQPGNLYGVSKVIGETLAKYYSEQKGLSCICLRLGCVGSKDDTEYIKRFYNIYISYEDMAQLFIKCIDAPQDLRFGIFNGLSNNSWKRLDLSKTCAILDYNPQFDSYALLEKQI